ncbi:unnamed protein product, partial [Mesorhabditis spiculigera]
MGNVFRKRVAPAEELETISAQVKYFREDIQATADRRKCVLWRLTILVFFLTTSAIAYGVLKFQDKSWVLISGSLATVGLLLLYLVRRVINAYYAYSVARKQRHLDTAIEKKKQVLENVKETETFKVAQQLLEKYDEGERVEKKPEAKVDADGFKVPEGKPNEVVPQTPQNKNNGNGRMPMATPTPGGPGPKINPRTGAPTPMKPMPRTMPVRPFVPEGKTLTDKLVDYFLGDGPGSRYALLCQNCHAHNGMALPAEYEYLPFCCFRCGHLNPAKKLRSHLAPSAAPTPAHGSPLEKPVPLRNRAPPQKNEVEEKEKLLEAPEEKTSD